MAAIGPEALARLADRHAAALVLYARQWCAAPEDVVQEAFLKLVGQRKPPDNPVPWLYRVVRNAAVSAARSERRRRRHETTAAARKPEWFTPGDFAGIEPGAAADALRGLPLGQREVIVAHLWGGLTFEQIGELTGTSSSTAHRGYVAGLSSLRERLGVPCPKSPATPT